jgi:sigma-B regulation protein RsbU (phosphoserine phosphatase)
MDMKDRPLESSIEIGSAHAELPLADWKDAQNKAVRQNLKPVTAWFGIIAILHGASYLIFQNFTQSISIIIVAGITSLIMFGLNLFVINDDLPLRWSHPVGALVICVLLVNNLFFIIHTSNINDSIYQVLILVGISLFIINHTWFIALVLLTLVSWGITVSLLPTVVINENSVIAFITAMGFALLFHMVNIQFLKKTVTADYQKGVTLSHLKRAIEEMKSRNEQLRLNDTALNAAANGISITDTAANILWINPAFTKITGYSAEDIIGKTPEILNSGHQDKAFYKNLWETISRGEVWSGNLINRHKNGTLYYEEQTITPVLNEQGEIVNYVGIKQDVTTRVQAQEEIERRYQEMSHLNDAIAKITSSLNLSEVEQNIVETVKQFFPQVFGATLQLLDEEGNLVTKTFTQYLADQTPEIPFRAGRGVAGIALQKRELVNIGDVENDPRFIQGKTVPPFKSLLSIPLVYRERIFGTLSIEGKTVHAFGTQEENLFKIFTGYAAAAIQNALYSEHLEDMIEKRTQELQLAQEKILLQQQVEQEIKLAVEVQQNLLPRCTPDLPGYSIAARAIPAHSVGGDFYDFIIRSDQVVYLVLADIAGKGIPAAMLTSTARSLYRLSSGNERGPAQALCEVNERMYDDLTQAGMFITMLAAQLNCRDGKIDYANAGHTEALLWCMRDRSCKYFPVTGIPLGIQQEFDLTELEIAIYPGDVLVLYSDGITEATNPQGQQFGRERMQMILQLSFDQEPEELLNQIIQGVDEFGQNAPHSDDITLIILKALPRHIPFLFPAALEQLDSISALIHQNAEGFGHTFAYQIELATSEIITNIITHAYAGKSGEVRGDILVSSDQMTFDFYDDGASFDMNILTPVDLTQPHEGGYGLFVASQLADELTYEPGTSSGNHWHLVKKYAVDS